jgi:hypothetical protein
MTPPSIRIVSRTPWVSSSTGWCRNVYGFSKVPGTIVRVTSSVSADVVATTRNGRQRGLGSRPLGVTSRTAEMSTIQGAKLHSSSDSTQRLPG